MARYWILVADPRRAEVYAADDFDVLTERDRFEHQEYVWRDYDVQAGDRDRMNQPTGDARTPLSPSTPDEGAERAAFARRLIAALEDARKGEEFERLVLVAEPVFLEALFDALPERLEERVVATVEESLVDTETNALTRMLRERLPEELVS